MSERNKSHEFSITQYYRITPDESEIDRELEHYIDADEQRKQQYAAFLHRLFQAIVSNESSLQQCMVYLTLVHQDSCVEGEGYVEEFYEERVQDFLDILGRLTKNPKECPFAPEDRAQVIAAIKEAQAYDPNDPYAREGIYNHFEPLQEALRAKVTPSGFEVKRHVYHCPDCGTGQ